MTVRPRRSVLYIPGSNARAMEKARSLPADAIILDTTNLSLDQVVERMEQAIKKKDKGERKT